MRGPSRICHGTGLSWLAPTPRTWTPPSSLPRRVRFGVASFCRNGCTTGCWGRVGGYGWMRGGVAQLDRPLRLGVVNGWWGWQPEFPGAEKRWGEVRPPPSPPRNGGEDVRVGANQHLPPPERKKGGAPTGDSSPTAGRGWAWGGFSMRGRPGLGRRPGRRCWTKGASAQRWRTGGRMPGWCTASPPGPSLSPSPPQPSLGAPRSRTPPNPRDAFAKALWAISPALDRQGTVC